MIDARKMCRIATVLLFGMLFETVFCQVWQKQTTNTTEGLFGIFMADSVNGWAVGDSATIIRTTNGGNSWLSQISNDSVKLNSVFFVNTNVGWTVGDRGLILHTTNGGNSWSSQTSTTYAPLWDVFFLTDSLGWVVGGIESLTGVFGVILKTENGGDTWSNLIDDSAGGFQGVHFIDELTGWVVGGKSLLDNFSPDIVLHTTNGGLSWVEQPTPTNGPLYRVKFLNNMVGWAVGFSQGGGTVALKTTDGGNTWDTVPFQSGQFVTTEGILGISLPDSSNIWIVRAQSIYHSTNSGLSFARVEPSPDIFLGSSFLDPLQGWFSCAGGIIWKYKDTPVSVSYWHTTPSMFSLEQNFPNPFNPSTVIEYSIPSDGHVSLKVFDLLGNEVVNLVERFEPKGHKLVRLDGSGLSSGVYVYVLRVHGEQLVSRKMLLIR